MSLGRALSLTLAVLFGIALVRALPAASLAYSTYLKDGLTPKAMVSDAQGNLYLAGKVVTDPVSGATSAVAAKLDPYATAFLYFVYLDSVASDDVRAIAVDGDGNAYVAGATSNPDFPATRGGLGTAPASAQDSRSFLTKLSPNGSVIFSVLLGGSASSAVDAIALTPQGRILISGTSASSGFPVTPGAYTVVDSKQRPFLVELDSTATTVIFSATGIGGSSIALDGAGNIYVAGSTSQLDYPTTPGAYQTTFTPSFVCTGLCQVGTPGLQQYLSKIDPAGSRLIYSTGINGAMAFRSASTRNTGLAVDISGNAYVTGVLDGDSYPFTTALPASPPYEFGFLTKLDPSGATVLYSLPMGGGGVQIDAAGALYTAGTVTSFNPGINPSPAPVAVPSALAWVPPQCLPNNLTANSEAYVMKLDPATGVVMDAQWIDGSALSALTMAFGSGRVWIAGPSGLADVPITPEALPPANLRPGILPGTFLSAVDFSQLGASPNNKPQIACVVDGGNLMHAGPVAGNQLLTLFGAGLGPSSGAAPDEIDGSIAGVTVTFDGVPAQLLYASSSQVNVVTPPGFGQKPFTTMQLSVNGVPAGPRQLPVTRSNPNLLADLSGNQIKCPPAGQTAQGFAPVADNADGSRNSCANPAKLGSIVSFYVHGIGNPACFCWGAMFGSRSAAVVNIAAVSPFLTRVDVQIPSSFATGSISSFPAVQEGYFPVSLSLDQAPLGPQALPRINVAGVGGPLIVWATQ